jgi:hypothetical protein
MLTDYLVHCPHNGCEWRGCLFPEGNNRDAWRPAQPTTRQVKFRCPRCQRTWQARIVGEDAIALPVESEVPVQNEV